MAKTAVSVDGRCPRPALEDSNVCRVHIGWLRRAMEEEPRFASRAWPEPSDPDGMEDSPLTPRGEGDTVSLVWILAVYGAAALCGVGIGWLIATRPARRSR